MNRDMSVPEILNEAASLIRKGWTMNAEARDLNGNIVHVTSDDAVSFCVLGAIHRITYKALAFRGYMALAEFEGYVRSRLHGGSSISHWNDHIAKDQEAVAIALENCAKGYKE
jgi:hypothetical protein